MAECGRYLEGGWPQRLSSKHTSRACMEYTLIDAVFSFACSLIGKDFDVLVPGQGDDEGV